MRTTATLIATLMLGVASCAYAQGGPREGLSGDAGPGGGAVGIGGGAPGGDGPRGGGPGGDGPSGAMEQGPAGGGEGLGGRERGGPSAEGTTTRSETGDGKASRAERRANDDGGGKTGTEKSARRDKSDDKTDDSAASEKVDKPDRAAKDAAGEGVKDSQDTTTTKKEDDPVRAEKAERVKHVDLSGGKRDRVQSAFRDKADIKRRTDVDIDISIGRRMPRDWHFAPVPITVIELVPEYRDYVFVYVEDEYVICDPDTYEVVALVPAGGSGGYVRTGDASCSTRIRLDEDQRELILKSVRPGREIDVDDLEVGWSVPGDIELREFPSEVLSEADELSGCRYFIADDQLAVVDPEEDKVVLLINKS